MAKVTLFADTRRQAIVNNKQAALIKIRFRVGTKDSTMSTGVKVDDVSKFDPDNTKTGPLLPGSLGNSMTEKSANVMLRNMIARAVAARYDMDCEFGIDGYSIDDLKQRILEDLSPVKADRAAELKAKKELAETNVLHYWREYLREKQCAERTAKLYQQTERRLKEYLKDDGTRWWTEELRFEDMTTDWLTGFEKSIMTGQIGNVVIGGGGARGVRKGAGSASCRIYMSCLRAFCTWAYDKEKTDRNVFRGHKLPEKGEAVVEPLTDEELRLLFSPAPEGEDWIQQYMDIALLGTMLIGMNIVDMSKLKNKDLRNGYIRYKRSKTGRPYCIRVEPCAMRLLDKLRNDDHDPDAPLMKWVTKVSRYTEFCKTLNKALQKKGTVTYKAASHGLTKKWTPYVENMYYYRLRHTWATIAYQLKIPRDDIRQALGHGRREVTDVYIKYGQEPIDAANEKVCRRLCEIIGIEY